MAAVLLVLGGVHSRVVGNTDDESAADADIRADKQRVCRNVKADVLHGAEGARAAYRRAESCFKSNFFVRRPFRIYFIVFCGKLRYLRAGCARIAGDKANACLVKSASDGFVAEHDFFHFSRSFPYLPFQHPVKGNNTP